MTNKVTLPKEVAEAVEEYRRLHLTEASLMDISNFINLNRYSSDDDNAIGKFITEAFDTNLPIYMAALVNGYTIEQTPEEKVREYYELATEGFNDADGFEEASANYHEGEMAAIKQTLNLLGIKIEGINA